MSSISESMTLTPDSKKIFYGWWVVVACIIVALCSSLARFGFSMFMPYIIKDFGWTRTMVGGAFTLHMAIYAVIAVYVGRLVDRFGARWIMFTGSFLLLVGMFMHSRMSTVVDIYIYYSVICGLGVAGTLMVPNVTTARKWFTRKAGLAIGLVIAGSGLGVVVAGPVVPYFCREIGWRNSYVALALVCGLVGMAASLLVRKDPESMGLKPDGMESKEMPACNQEKVSVAESYGESEWTVKEALKTKEFWIIISSYTLYLVPSMGLLSNAGAFGHDLAAGSGLSDATSGPLIGQGFMLMGVTALISEILSGYLADRFGRKPILFTSFGLVSLCFLWAINLETMSMYMLFMGVYGFCFGLGVPPWVPLMSDCFGRGSIGTLYGILTLFGGGLSGLGGILFGRFFDATGSYDGAFWVGIVMLLMVIVGITQIKPGLSLPEKIETMSRSGKVA